jgi:four helix bundle protein
MPAAATDATATDGTVLLDAERFDCYRVALDFQTLAADLLPKGCGSLRDQLDRASVSIVLNLAEGIGRRGRNEKARFYAIARGSAAECAAVLDLASRRSLTNADTCASGRKMLIRIVQMLVRLEQRMRR